MRVALKLPLEAPARLGAVSVRAGDAFSALSATMFPLCECIFFLFTRVAHAETVLFVEV
jgi:hypothetical protein